MGRPDCNAETRSAIKFGQIRKFFLDDKGYCRTVRKLPTPPLPRHQMEPVSTLGSPGGGVGLEVQAHLSVQVWAGEAT